MEKIYTRKEAAKALGICIHTLDSLRVNGEIEFIQRKANSNVYFTESAINNYLMNVSSKVESSHPPKHNSRRVYRYYLSNNAPSVKIVEEDHSVQEYIPDKNSHSKSTPVGISQATVTPGIPPVYPRIMTIHNAAMTGILPEGTLRKLAKEGKLPAIKSGNTTLINFDKLIDMLDSLGDSLLEK